MKRKFLKRKVLNTIYWTSTVIAICMLLMSNLDWEQVAGCYLFLNMLVASLFDKKFNETNGFI